jgi:hypothetical protein
LIEELIAAISRIHLHHLRNRISQRAVAVLTQPQFILRVFLFSHVLKVNCQPIMKGIEMGFKPAPWM